MTRQQAGSVLLWVGLIAMWILIFAAAQIVGASR